VTGDLSTLEVAGRVLEAIGHKPNTAFLKGQVSTDEQVTLSQKPGTTETSKAGVFAAGDVQEPSVPPGHNLSGKRLHGGT